jgi:hypothetical protein
MLETLTAPPETVAPPAAPTPADLLPMLRATWDCGLDVVLDLVRRSDGVRMRIEPKFERRLDGDQLLPQNPRALVDGPLLPELRRLLQDSDARKRWSTLVQQHSDAIARRDSAAKRLKSATLRREVAQVDLSPDLASVLRLTAGEIAASTAERDSAAADAEALRPLMVDAKKIVEDEVRMAVGHTLPTISHDLYDQILLTLGELVRVAGPILDRLAVLRLAQQITEDPGKVYNKHLGDLLKIDWTTSDAAATQTPDALTEPAASAADVPPSVETAQAEAPAEAAAETPAAETTPASTTVDDPLERLGERIFQLLVADSQGMTRPEIRDRLNRNRSAGEISQALALLQERGKARCDAETVGLRGAAERWHAVSG